MKYSIDPKYQQDISVGKPTRNSPSHGTSVALLRFDSVALTRFLKATNDTVKRMGPMGKITMPMDPKVGVVDMLDAWRIIPGLVVK